MIFLKDDWLSKKEHQDDIVIVNSKPLMWLGLSRLVLIISISLHRTLNISNYTLIFLIYLKIYNEEDEQKILTIIFMCLFKVTS